MTKDAISDQWILDLSVDHHDREIRSSIFKAYTELRKPVWFNDHKRPDVNYLSVFTWDDVSLVSSKSDIFHSKEGYLINDNFDRMSFDGSLLSMNGEEHKNMRAIVSFIFTNKMVQELEPMIRRIAKKAFEQVLSQNDKIDIFKTVCTDIPLNINAEMMGMPEELKYEILNLTKFIVVNDDPDYGNSKPLKWLQATKKMKNHALSIGELNKNSQNTNMTTMLLNSMDNSKNLTLEEYSQFFMLLVIAGMETTTHSLAHGIKLLYQNPDQLDLLKNNFDTYIETACEEILRVEPTVLHFRRTATIDTEISGVPVKKGDRILTWYNCANNDPEKFNNPYEFDITRPKRPPHTTFGGPGIHHCLGAGLARLEMKIFYEYLFEYIPEIKLDLDNIKYVKTRWANGYKSMPLK